LHPLENAALSRRTQEPVFMPRTHYAGSTKFGGVGGESRFTAISSPYIKVDAEHVWGQVMADIMANGMARPTRRSGTSTRSLWIT
jgi:hypothetical protein